MVGTTHRLILRLIELRTGGNPALVPSLKIKLIMKGVDPDQHNANSPDDRATIARLYAIAKDMSIEL